MLQVSAVPSVLAVKNGEVKNKFVGLQRRKPHRIVHK